MSQDSSQDDKTEEPTGKRISDAREKGNVPKSKELGTMLSMFIAFGMLIFYGPTIGQHFIYVMTHAFSMPKDAVYDPEVMMSLVGGFIGKTLFVLLPFLVVSFFAAFLSPFFMGGIVFNPSSLEWKLDKFNIVKGLKKIFSVNGLIELVKAFFKFVLISIFAVTVIYFYMDDYLSLSELSLEEAIANGILLFLIAAIIVSSSMILLAVFDVPYQLWDYKRKLKMTRHEVKEEFKNTEGNPEVKGKIRRLQMELAMQRMMQDVPKADVVITNPSHFAVALQYEQEKGGAPVVIAKGTDLIAEQILKIAKANRISSVQAPPLARSLFFNTKIGQEIPEGLYIAVARVLAYVFQLRKYLAGKSARPKVPKDLPIPTHLKR